MQGSLFLYPWIRVTVLWMRKTLLFLHLWRSLHNYAYWWIIIKYFRELCYTFTFSYQHVCYSYTDKKHPHVSWGNFTAFIKTFTYLYLGCLINLGLPVFKCFQTTIPSNPYQFTIHNTNITCYCWIDSVTSKWWDSWIRVCVFCAL